MNKITRENLKADPDIENAYQTIITLNGQSIDISLNPDDVEVEKTIDLANKIISNYEHYEFKKNNYSRILRNL